MEVPEILLSSWFSRFWLQEGFFPPPGRVLLDMWGFHPDPLLFIRYVLPLGLSSLTSIVRLA